MLVLNFLTYLLLLLSISVPRFYVQLQNVSLMKILDSILLKSMPNVYLFAIFPLRITVRKQDHYNMSISLNIFEFQK